MNAEELHKLADELFYIFTLVNPDDDAEHTLSSRTNKVLSFENYIKTTDWKIIHKYCEKFTQSDMHRFRKVVANMTTHYLNQNIKTLALY